MCIWSSVTAAALTLAFCLQSCSAFALRLLKQLRTGVFICRIDSTKFLLTLSSPSRNGRALVALLSRSTSSCYQVSCLPPATSRSKFYHRIPGDEWYGSGILS
jgi:hypothetical protein